MDRITNQALSVADGVALFSLILIAYGIVEGLYVHLRRHAARLREYRMMGFGLTATALAFAVCMLLIGPLNATILAIWGSQFSLWDADYGPAGWVYGLIVYEFAYWVQHWLGHKVRLLWCVHSPHHAPESMSMFVGFNHSFIETVFYLPLAVGLSCALLGVHPLVVAGVSFIDAGWGNLLHVSDQVVSRRYGILERFLQTPSYHRVHHAQNVRYMDTNYNSITLLWDWLLGTLQPLDDQEPVVYGITRDVDTGSFWDVHFKEFVLLWRDMRSAPSVGAAIGYLLNPPGWSATGESNTASARKRRLIEESVASGET